MTYFCVTDQEIAMSRSQEGNVYKSLLFRGSFSNVYLRFFLPYQLKASYYVTWTIFYLLTKPVWSQRIPDSIVYRQYVGTVYVCCYFPGELEVSCLDFWAFYVIKI